MSYSKSHHFKLDPLLTSQFCRTLMHPARLQILFFLFKNGQSNYDLIYRNIPLSRPSVSRHIRQLLDAHCVILQDLGNKTFYEINPERLELYAIVFRDLALEINKGLLELPDGSV